MKTYPQQPGFKLNLGPNNIGASECSDRVSLTISAVLELNKLPPKILEIQNNIIGGLEISTSVCSGIYKYPKHTLHFSIIDFLDHKSNLNQTPVDIFIKNNYSSIEKIKNILEKFTLQSVIDRELDCGFIYTGEEGAKEDLSSIAIQVYPKKELYDFFVKLKDELSKHSLGRVEIKSIQNIRFVLNLIRFFRKLSEEEKKTICKEVNELNQDSKNNPLFSLQLSRLSFVVSNDWLSNSNPELYYIN